MNYGLALTVPQTVAAQLSAVLALADEERAADRAEIERLRESLALWGRLYREAVGVPETEHQQRRMDQVAQEWERATGRASAAEARLDALVADLRGLADDAEHWLGATDGWAVRERDLCAVLDKHAGEHA